jgi:hypothetical protein
LESLDFVLLYLQQGVVLQLHRWLLHAHVSSNR